RRSRDRRAAGEAGAGSEGVDRLGEHAVIELAGAEDVDVAAVLQLIRIQQDQAIGIRAADIVADGDRAVRGAEAGRLIELERALPNSDCPGGIVAGSLEFQRAEPRLIEAVAARQLAGKDQASPAGDLDHRRVLIEGDVAVPSVRSVYIAQGNGAEIPFAD